MAKYYRLTKKQEVEILYTYSGKPLYLPTMWVKPDGTSEPLGNKANRQMRVKGQ